MNMWLFGGILVIQIVLGVYGLLTAKRRADGGKTQTSSKGKAKKVKVSGMLFTAAGIFLVYVIFTLPKMMFPDYEPIAVTGTHEVEMQTYTWVDESRVETFTDTGENRALTVKFWYPKEEGSYPLVVFSHGAFGIIDSNYSTCMELASNGYVVASIGHPYHAMFVQDINGKVTIADMEFVQKIYAGNGTDDPDEEQANYAESKEWMAVRTGDENFVLDTILAKAAAKEDGPFALIDADKIGLFGHSMGGASSVQLGRERTDIDAVIDLEGTMFGEYTNLTDGVYSFKEEPYPVPLLDVNSKVVDEQARNLPGGQEYVNFYVGENAPEYSYVVFENAGHLNFTDLPVVSPGLASLLGVGEVDARECIENVNEMVLQFFDYYLKGNKDAVWKSVY